MAPGGADGSRGDTAPTRRGGGGGGGGGGCGRGEGAVGMGARDAVAAQAGHGWASRAYPQPNRFTVTAALSSAVSTRASRTTGNATADGTAPGSAVSGRRQNGKGSTN